MSPEIVAGCLDLDEEDDRRFEDLWRRRLSDPRARSTERVLPGVIGHVAESVVEVMLDERGFVPLAHHAGPGRHGVDLLMAHLESESVFAFEVKGTLRSAFIPGLTAGDLAQMSSAWIDKPDNPAMSGAALTSSDVYGAVAAVNLADLALRVAITDDFAAFRPVVEGEMTRPVGD